MLVVGKYVLSLFSNMLGNYCSWENIAFFLWFVLHGEATRIKLKLDGKFNDIFRIAVWLLEDSVKTVLWIVCFENNAWWSFFPVSDQQSPLRLAVQVNLVLGCENVWLFIVHSSLIVRNLLKNSRKEETVILGGHEQCHKLIHVCRIKNASDSFERAGTLLFQALHMNFLNWWRRDSNSRPCMCKHTNI